MKKSLAIVIISVIAVFSISSCKKYNDGGLVSRAEKRLSANTWALEKYLRNGNDETSLLLIRNFTEHFSDNGVLTRNYIDKDGDPFNEMGSWEFDNKKEQINLPGVGSIELTEETSTVSTSDYNIIRLKKKELWYSYDNGGDNHEFHFVPN